MATVEEMAAVASPPSACVLLVEDDDALRGAVRVALEEAGLRVREAGDARAALESLERLRPDLAVIDISLPNGEDGFGLAREIRGRADVPMVFLTAADALSDRLRGFDLGADDYIVKPFALPELVARLNAVLRRAGRLRSPVMELFDVVIDENRRTVKRGGEVVALTSLEFELLVALVKHRGQPVSKRRLLALVWGFDELDPNVVEVHVSSLRRKLERHGRRLIFTERNAGYLVHV